MKIRVRFQKTVAGPDYAYTAGSVHDVDTEIAASLISSEACVPVGVEVENASLPPAANTANPPVFASPAAQEAAEKAGLSAADFAGRTPKGDKGWTKGEVDEIAKAK